MKSDDGALRIVVLETANLEEIKKGRLAKTPDGSVLISWTPGMVWLADQLMSLPSGDAEAVGRLIDEASRRPEKPGPRPKHKPHQHKFGGS